LVRFQRQFSFASLKDMNSALPMETRLPS